MDTKSKNKTRRIRDYEPTVSCVQRMHQIQSCYDCCLALSVQFLSESDQKIKRTNDEWDTLLIHHISKQTLEMGLHDPFPHGLS